MFVCQRGREEADVSVQSFKEGDAVEAHILFSKTVPLPALAHKLQDRCGSR